jgi:exopolyphosphatase / guanosine-5'-triphosphate,3'-diphosphate pyrophosphatase
MTLLRGQALAIFDIGSNAVRLTGYRLDDDGPTQILKKRELCEMGRPHDRPDYLYPEGVARAQKTITHYCDLIRDAKFGFSGVVAVATEAVRSARDGQDFVRHVQNTNGLQVRILSEQEEGILGAAGVLRDIPDADGIVADLGGGSLQLTRVHSGRTHETKSFPLGGLRLFGARNELDTYIDQHLKNLPAPLAQTDTLYVIGSWRGFAELYQQRRGVHDRDLRGVEMEPDMISALVDWLFSEPPHVMQDILMNDYGFEKSRAELMPYGGHLLRRVIDLVAAKIVIVSSSGVRDGILQAVIDGEMALDPLPQPPNLKPAAKVPVATPKQTT